MLRPPSDPRTPRALRLMLVITALGLLAWAGPGHALPFTATVRNDYPCGSMPRGAITADVNNDGKPDVITANYSDGTVSVLLNAGNGTYNPKTDYNAGFGATSVMAYDLNNDGYQDLIVAAQIAGMTEVLLGDGTGAFPTKVDYPSGTDPVRATLGYIDGDAIPDLITVNRGSNTVSVRLGTGGGAFGPKVDYAVGSYPVFVEVRDIDGDGFSDILTANFYGLSVSVLKSNGSGGFLPHADIAMGANCTSLALGYFNDDNTLDLAVTMSNTNRLAVMTGNGTGGFGSRVDLVTSTYPSMVRIGDVNLDGHTDLAVSNYSTAVVSLFLGNGTGGFAPRLDFSVGTSPTAVYMLDATGDGEPDLVSCSESSNSVTVRRGNVPGGFAVGDTLVDLTATDDTGAPRLLSAGAGKWRIVDLCSVWCTPCNYMATEARQVCDTWANVYPLPFEYLTVISQGESYWTPSTLTDADSWKTKYQLDSPVVHTNGKKQNNIWTWERGVGSNAYPTFFILDPDGKIRERHVGALSGQDLVDHIAAQAGITPSPTLAPALTPPPPPPPPAPTAPWRALATAAIEIHYGASVWSGALFTPVSDSGTQRTFHITPFGVPGITGAADIWVTAETDSTTGIESFGFLIGTSSPSTAISQASSWQVVLKNMVWDDAQERVLVPGSDTGQLWSLHTQFPYATPIYDQLAIDPTITYSGTMLSFTPMAIASVPHPSNMYAFYLGGGQLQHKYAPVVAGVGSPGVAMRLVAARPNPSRTATRVEWAMAHTGRAQMRILDVSGRVVRSLVDGTVAAGDHATTWDLRDGSGGRVAPGVYFVHLEALGQPRQTTRVVVIE